LKQHGPVLYACRAASLMQLSTQTSGMQRKIISLQVIQITCKNTPKDRSLKVADFFEVSGFHR
jgi:hypothetical protein